MRKNNEYDKFDRTMRMLISVPHSDIKDKLDAEKREKKKKRKSKASASDRASGGDKA